MEKKQYKQAKIQIIRTTDDIILTSTRMLKGDAYMNDVKTVNNFYDENLEDL